MSRPDAPPPLGAPAHASATLRAIFDRFAGCEVPAYRHRDGAPSFARLHAATRGLLPALAGLPRARERRPVLVFGHKDPRYPVAYWACLLTGRALVPIEPETPPARLLQIVASCDPDAILVADGRAETAERLRALVDPARVAVLGIADPCAASREPATPAPDLPEAADDDVAYVMFSSGTLGAPKGIQVTYANLVDFVAWLDVLLPEGPRAGDGVTGVIRHCFDVSLFEVWTSWTRLLPITALDHADVADSTGYVARLAQDDVSLFVATPSIARLFLKNRRFCAATLPRLSTFLFCGEPLTKAIVAELFARFPGCRVVNTYGPTECTVAVTAVDVTPELLAAPGDLPIGTARAGTRVEAAPGTLPGQAGEIWISGASVGRGYIGLPDKQAAAFPRPGVYRTGDRGACDAEGTWSFLGRLDREVKIQGYRVDLGEIEAHIRRRPGVEDAAVEPYLLHGEARALQAFVIGPGAESALEALAQALSDELPPYLVPRFWFAGFETGMNLNSKLDRSQLAHAASVATLRHVHMPVAHMPVAHMPAAHTPVAPAPAAVRPALPPQEATR